MALGFIYIPAEELAAQATMDEILSRLKKIEPSSPIVTAQADAMLGLIEPTTVTITKAFQIYCEKICAVDLKGKSDTQVKNWTKVKRRAVNNFVAVCGDLPMNKIERKHARQIYDWWSKRVGEGSKAAQARKPIAA